jgi:plastocyanin
MKRTYLFVLLFAMISASCGGAASETTTTAATSTTASTTTTAAPTTTASPTTTSAGTTTTASTGTGGSTVDVFVEDFSFSPSTVTIKVGDTVRWNLVGGSHTTTSGTSPTPDGGWNQTLQSDPPVTVTFAEAGTFNYFCRFHGDFMSGRVVVEP